MAEAKLAKRKKFLSTLPARGATAPVRLHFRNGEGFLSTLPARGATKNRPTRTAVPSFLSTLPARGATPSWERRPTPGPISIHAPREGSDAATNLRLVSFFNFYPRSPRGERPYWRRARKKILGHFYPRSPRGERPQAACSG